MKRTELSFETVQPNSATAEPTRMKKRRSFMDQSLFVQRLQALGDRLAIDDAWCDEDQQLLPAVGFRSVAEEEPEDRYLPEERNRAHLIGASPHVDPADHRGVAILHQYLGGGFLPLDRRLSVGAGVGWVRLIVLRLDVQQYRPVVGDVRSDLERQARFNKGGVHTAGGHLAERDGHALADLRRVVVERGHLRSGDRLH